MKEESSKQQKIEDEDEVDNMVGYRRDHTIVIINGSESNLDTVDGAVSFRHTCTDTYTEDDGRVLLGNALGSRDEKAIKLTELKDEITDNSQEYPFTALQCIGTLVSLILFVVDVVTDILLAMEYRDHDRVLEFALTSSMIIASFLVTGILSTIWYIQDVTGPKSRVKKILFLIAAFPFSIIIRNLVFIKHGWLSRKSRSEEKSKHYKQMMKEGRDVSLLMMFDSFVESAPQLIIQMYIAMHHPSQESLHLEILRSFTIATSLAGLSWSVTSYYRNLRISSATSGLKANSICGAVGYFLWRVFEIGPRITAIVMLLSVDSHGLYIIFGSLVHWFIMLTMAFLRHVKVYDEPIQNIMFIVFISFVQIISYMNLSHGKSRRFAIIYYTLFYVENVLMVLLFVLWTDIDKSSWIFIVTVCVASSGTLFCTLFMVMYYKLCHPKVSHKSTDVDVELKVKS